MNQDEVDLQYSEKIKGSVACQDRKEEFLLDTRKLPKLLEWDYDSNYNDYHLNNDHTNNTLKYLKRKSK